MAKSATKASLASNFSPPPGRKGKAEPISDEAPALVVCIHILRPMTQGKKRAQRQEANREQ